MNLGRQDVLQHLVHGLEGVVLDAFGGAHNRRRPGKMWHRLRHHPAGDVRGIRGDDQLDFAQRLGQIDGPADPGRKRGAGKVLVILVPLGDRGRDVRLV